MEPTRTVASTVSETTTRVNTPAHVMADALTAVHVTHFVQQLLDVADSPVKTAELVNRLATLNTFATATSSIGAINAKMKCD